MSPNPTLGITTVTTVPQATHTTPAKPPRVYIAGPMSGIVDDNYPAFNRAASLLRGCGFVVENPAENKAPDPPTWHNWMRQAIPQMLSCDAVVLLPGWEKSKGVAAEKHLANLMDMPVVTITNALLLLEDLLAQPRQIATQDA